MAAQVERSVVPSSLTLVVPFSLLKINVWNRHRYNLFYMAMSILFAGQIVGTKGTTERFLRSAYGFNLVNLVDLFNLFKLFDLLCILETYLL